MTKVIPSYATDYPKEFLLITGIERCFKYYVNLIQSQRYNTLDNRLEKVNKYLDLYQKKIRVPTEIQYDDLKHFIVLDKLVNGINDNFEDYVGCCETDVDDIDFFIQVLLISITHLKDLDLRLFPEEGIMLHMRLLTPIFLVDFSFISFH